MELNVSEIFYSLQGEGVRAGEPSVFVRLQGCSAKHACYASGVRCDTEFESGKPVELDDLLGRLRRVALKCSWIIWTGGEPLDQLTPEALDFFREAGYMQALETSGVRPLTQGIVQALDWIVLSPKVAEHVLAKQNPEPLVKNEREAVHVHELRYVLHVGREIPQPALRAAHYVLSPHSDGQELNEENLQHCMRLCLENPQWRLSPQMHKLWRVL